MARRKASRRRDAGLARGTKLGRHSLTFNDDEVLHLLRKAVEREESQGVFARRHGIDRSFLNQMLNGKSPLPNAVLKALRLRKVYAPE